jgi:hypothetical protein
MNPTQVVEQVDFFLTTHPSGWIREPEITEFLNNKCSLVDVCQTIPQVTDGASLESLLKFLESVASFPTVASELCGKASARFLIAALDSQSVRLRTIVVTALSAVKSPSLPLEIDDQILLRLLTDDDTGISVRASRLIVDWMDRQIVDANLKQSFATRLVTMYTKSRKLNETEEFRFISLFIELGKLSSDIFDIFISKELFDPILSQFLSSNSDLLVKLGSVTLIESLAQYEAGQRYLGQIQVLHALETELSGPLADSTTQISLLMSIASILPFVQQSMEVKQMLSPKSDFTQVVFRFIISANNAERMCAMKVFGLLARAGDKSNAVEAFLKLAWRPLNEVIYALSDVDVEVVNTALDSMWSMIRNWEHNPYMQSVDSQTTLVNQVQETFTRHPFPECRCLVYALTSAILIHENLSDMALSAILSEPSPIRAALLDYQSESNYDSRRAKCDLVRVLVKREEKIVLGKFFNKEQVENFIDFAEKGLEWVPVSKAKDEMETEAL